MSNWALELQQFSIERIWIRGEANVLADAPSRAPWEKKLAQFLPIPDMPARDLIVKLYQAPDAVEELVSRRRTVLTGDAEWEPMGHDGPPSGPFLDQVLEGSLPTPDFGSGARTPDFGTAGERTGSLTEGGEGLGPGRVLRSFGAEWPRFPVWVVPPIRYKPAFGTSALL